MMLAALAATLATPAAFAKTSHFYESVIREVPAIGPGGPVPAPGLLDDVNSMTVFSGELYVAERLEENNDNSRVDQFARSASKPGEYEFVSQLPLQPGPGQIRAAGIAFGSAAGEMETYLGVSPRFAATSVNVFAAGLCGNLECATFQTLWTGAGVPEETRPFAGVSGVVVDHSTSPGDWAIGDVFVVDTGEAVTGRIHPPAIDIFEPQAGGEEHYVSQVTGSAGPMAVSGFNGDLIVGDKVFRPEEEGARKGKYGLVCQLVPPGGPLVGEKAVAVDDSAVMPYEGDIYVLTNGAVYEFGPECGFRGEITGVPRESTPTGVKGQTEEVPFGFGARVPEPRSVAVDPVSHKLFVGMFFGLDGPRGENLGVVDVFGPDVVTPDVVTKAPSNLVLESDAGSGVVSWRVRPRGSVNPLEEGEASCSFAWGATESFGQEAPCSIPVANGGSLVSVQANLTGLAPDTTYVYRLQATNKNGTDPGEASEDYRFTTPGPGLRSESVSEVSSTGASFEATVAPHEAPIEEHDLQTVTKSPTSYFFQYSTQPMSTCASEPVACASVPAAPASVGSGAGDVTVSPQHAHGLSPNTTYHYRLVALSEALPATKPGVISAFYGADRRFTTQGLGGPVVLPDGRAWELVSPADKHGAVIEPSGQASVDGSGFTFLTSSPIEPHPAGSGEHGLQVLSSRVAPGQWSSVEINLSRSSPEGAIASIVHEYRYFSPDLGSSIVESEGPFSVPEEWHKNEGGEWERIVEAFPVPSERTPYLRHNSTCAAVPSRCFEPLLDSEDVTSGEKIEGVGTNAEGAAHFVGATPDAKHALISSSVQLTSTPTNSGGLYEWSADKPPAERLSLVNLVPGSSEPGERFAAGLSPDGSRVLFAGCAPPSGCGALYLRDVVSGETARLDLAENGSDPSRGMQDVEGASTDLSKVFFTDEARLTKDSGVRGADLYVCELGPEGAGAPKCALTDLTSVPAAGQPGASEDAQVSRALGVSRDGDYVYFLAKGVLAGGATPGTSLQENLYVAHEQEGRWVTSFIASAHVSLRAEGVDAESVVSPDGRWLAFSSSSSLTGYDNRDAKTGSPDSEVYLYDAETGRLVCASCNPSGARPIGPAVVPFSPHGSAGSFLLGTFVWQQEPGARSLFDGGRLFFDSKDALVPQDTNGNVDAYEYQPEGVGSCTGTDPTFDVVTGACVGLISSGRASGESVFLEASANASDVFFTTAERLVGQDRDTAVDIYDAHECSSVSPCAGEASAPEECTSAAACRAAPVPQPSVFGSPSSATFSGAGNVVSSPSAPVVKAKSLTRARLLARALKSCRKNRSRHKRVVCEVHAHKRYGAKASRRHR